MRYSSILGSVFYQIELDAACVDMLDTHYTAAAHHLIRFQECEIDSEHSDFHLWLHRAHLKAMMKIVFIEGRFSSAVDKDGLGLNKRESWNPELCQIPDPKMFEDMFPDYRFEIGEYHASDIYINNLNIKLSTRIQKQSQGCKQIH